MSWRPSPRGFWHLPRATISENKPMDTVFEHDLVEIDQQTQRLIREFHVAKQLRFVDGKDLLDSFKLNNQAIVNQDVKRSGSSKTKPLYRNDQCVLCRHISQLAFPAYAFVVNGLQQLRPLEAGDALQLQCQ
jgi:hypothetical protein